MKGERKYIAALILVAFTYILFELLSPEKVSWKVSYHKNDKNPYGAFLIHERLPDLFNEVNHSYHTIYELADTLDGGLFILSEDFNPPQEDVDALLDFVASGNEALISSSYFSQGKLLDTLDLQTQFYLIDNVLLDDADYTDSVEALVYPSAHKFKFSTEAVNTYFDKSNGFKTLATVDDYPVFIEVSYGNGKLYLNTTAMAFTNNYLLHSDHNEYLSNILSHLPQKAIYWTEYYQVGRLEARTPLRYILSNEALRNAYYVTIISLLGFILFEVKRKQRIIPTISPLKNSTLEFVKTLGNLYYQDANHKIIAEKRILFFMERLRSNYYFKNTDWTENFMNEVAQRTGNSIETTRQLFEQVSAIKNSKRITENQLITLNKNLDNFKITD